jgi:hypothetical protein
VNGTNKLLVCPDDVDLLGKQQQQQQQQKENKSLLLLNPCSRDTDTGTVGQVIKKFSTCSTTVFTTVHH